jgi:hypothetical protein
VLPPPRREEYQWMESANDNDAANNSNRRTTDRNLTLDDDDEADVDVRLDREELSFIIVLVAAFFTGGIVVMVHAFIDGKNENDTLDTTRWRLYLLAGDGRTWVVDRYIKMAGSLYIDKDGGK